MEKAILKTLIYADIFDYPLKVQEIHKWLIGKKMTLRQIEKILGKLNQESRIKNQGRYYFLRKRDGLVLQRRHREHQSAIYLRKARLVCQILKVIPWIKMVGISGGLALSNASKKDDIDLFIITAKNRLWISRLLTLGLLSLIGQRRTVGAKGRKIAGKLCPNILLEENRLEQQNKDIFVAHEVLQMKVLWQRDGIYSKYLSVNGWAFKFLPNWVTSWSARQSAKNRSRDQVARLEFVLRQANNSKSRSADVRSTALHFLTASGFAALIASYLDNLAKWLQLKIMSKPQGMERIEDGALYFHPNDIRQEVLSKYEQKLKKIISP